MPVPDWNRVRFNYVIRFWVAALVLWLGLGKAIATESNFTAEQYSARLVTKSATIKPGQPLEIALAFDLKPEWHIYYKDPGESGYPPRFNWTLPKGFTAGEIQHPEPKKMSVAGIDGNVHEGKPVLLQSIATPSMLSGAVKLPLTVDLLICTKSVCVPDEATFRLNMAIGDGTDDPKALSLFAPAKLAVGAANMPTTSGAASKTSVSLGLFPAFLIAFGSALLGGFILNLMPCVFPILSLKALALAKAGGDAKEAKQEAIGYSIGAVSVIVLFGAALIALRESGSALGWAFQLQDSRIVAILLLLVTAIAFNLAGLFELPGISVSRGQSNGFAGSIGTGALAAFIATPCTGPFMAGALGAALALPAFPALGVFLGLGLGFALPFLVLAYWERGRGWLPKPGVWMDRLRRLLSIPMFVTALGLAWIVGRQAGANGMAIAVGAAMLLALGLWWYGRLREKQVSTLPVMLPILSATALAFLISPAPATQSNIGALETRTTAYSAKSLADLRAQKKPVFLYMTADWCLSCKVNEATSLSNANVLAAFKQADVTIMRGDWTNGDAAISDFLKQNGHAGVPVYYWYPANGDPKEMPQILTPSMLTELVRPAA